MGLVKRKRWRVGKNQELVAIPDKEWELYGKEIQREYTVIDEGWEDDDQNDTPPDSHILSPDEEDIELTLPQLAAQYQATHQHGHYPTSYAAYEGYVYNESRKDCHEREMKQLLIAMANPRTVEGVDVEFKTPKEQFFGYM